VQEAAGILIDILIMKGDLYDAERYAQVTYSNLRDKKNGIDQESKAVAVGAYNLANVIYEQKGDLVKAEELARESLRIRTLIYGNNESTVDVCYDLLANILNAQGKFGNETRKLYERSLAISIRYEGPDGFNTAIGHYNIATFYHKLANIQPTVDLKRAQLLLAKSHFVEVRRIRSKIDGPTHPNTINVSSWLTIVLRELSEI
jgi:tetratricopeptide (TPR) repeat protein